MLPNFITEIENNSQLLSALMTNGKSKNIDDFNLYDEYITLNKEKPSMMRYVGDSSDYYDLKKIKKEIKINFIKNKTIYSENTFSIINAKVISKKDIFYLDNGYYLTLHSDSADNFFNNPKEDISVDNSFEICDYATLTLPPIDSQNYNEDIAKMVGKILKKSIIKENIKTTIGLAAIDNGDLYVRDFNIGNFSVKYMDLHYGDGFVEFNRKLIKKLKKDKKGLVLLHGLPGTGKTYYIRHLLSNISKTNNVLYFPPSMVNMITDPNFINFINTWVNDNGKNCILLIEDAEPLLVSRDDDRNIGITNLLNLTDGLLNDIFGIKIIATFNTQLSNLDTALLRPERLIARKEFTTLPKERALKLADKIKVSKDKIKDNMSLADIYAIKKNNEILLHNVDDFTIKTIGFK